MKVATFCLLLIILVYGTKEINKLHTHLHVIEKALTGKITDSDGSTEYKGEL
jgi:hypothetical protein